MKTSHFSTLLRKGRALFDVLSQTAASLRYSSATLKDNFRRHGAEFNVTNFQDFESMARHFFREAKHGKST
ncbi:MAG: hypothetical protein J0L97_02960, partial [Alphaproteobacteria bacterium]|nr:hypothetical protein [Alphaproteobacteria bacterium]